MLFAMVTLKVTRFGNSSGVILPREVLVRLRVEQGDTVYLTETPNGFEISPYDRAFAEEMAAARGVMRRYRNALRELAE
jgi:putative addiction module antidote